MSGWDEQKPKVIDYLRVHRVKEGEDIPIGVVDWFGTMKEGDVVTINENTGTCDIERNRRLSRSIPIYYGDED